MDDFTPAIAAVALAVLGALGTWYSGRKLKQLGLGVDQKQVNQTLRELADVREEKFQLVSADLVAEKVSHGVTKEHMADEQRAGDRCRRELDDVRSDLRALQRAPRRGRGAP